MPEQEYTPPKPKPKPQKIEQAEVTILPPDDLKTGNTYFRVLKDQKDK